MYARQLDSKAPVGGLDRFFKVRERGSSVKTEVTAGVTTFVTMAYILLVNSIILGDAGMNPSAVMMATALAAGFASILMGIYANLPFALAPGMGLNAYFAYAVVLGQGLSWETVLGAVFFDGVLFLILSLLPVRERIIQEIPLNLKLATSAAIGLFIAFIGLSNAGIVVADDATKVALGDITAPGTLVALFGLIVMGWLLARRVKGALLWGILAATVLGFFVPKADGTGFVSNRPAGLGDLFALPDWGIMSLTFGQLDIAEAAKLGLIAVIFTFTFVDLFDTAGTLIGLSTKLGIVDKKGSFPGAGRALIADSIATIMGSIFGTSTTTTYVESAAGVGEGGRTGLTAVTVGLLFLAAIFLWPLALIIPGAATAPALIIVGLMMLEPVLRLDLSDYTEALPAFLTIIMMPLTYSIANGIIFGILSYVVLKALTGRIREVGPTMWVLAVLFIGYFAL